MADKIKPIVAFGEAMIRLTPPSHERLERTNTLDLSPGGAELNVAVTLACLGLPVEWVSRLPENGLGRFIARKAREANVDLSHVQWESENDGRMGLYFLEEGADPRPSAVTYDRASSTMAKTVPGAFDWGAIFKSASALHVSGITPALGDGCRAETMAAMRAANAANVPVFFDLNYRSKLWSEDAARACFVELAPFVDVMFASRGGLRTFFGIEGDLADAMGHALTKLGLAAIAVTRKKGKVSRSLKLTGLAMGRAGKLIETDWTEIEVIDRLGGGDAFAGGFIAGYLEDSENLKRAAMLGLAASALKHTIPGDFLCATRAEIEAATVAVEGGVLQR